MKTSTEVLTHYQCESCEQWWTIGDAPEMAHMYCPRCGVVQLCKVDEKMAQANEELWTDERIAVCADIHSMGHYTTDNKAALEFRITTALKEMRNEYEAERAKLQEAAECIAELIQWLTDDNEGES